MRREQGYLDEAAGHVTLLRGCESLVGLVLIDDRETRGRRSRLRSGRTGSTRGTQTRVGRWPSAAFKQASRQLIRVCLCHGAPIPIHPGQRRDPCHPAPIRARRRP